MNIKVEVTSHADEIKQALHTQMEVALEKIGLAGESNAKEEITAAVYDTPEAKSGYVRTGRLRNSISHTSDGESAYIGTNVEYAAYVEMGTSRMAERPYLRPAVMDHIDEYRQIAEEALKG